MSRAARVALAVALAVAAIVVLPSTSSAAAATSVAPFTSIDVFVKQQYRDLTGREPFAVELSEAKAGLASGDDTVPEAIDAIAHQPDAAARTCNVGRLYTAYFLRLPDASGLEYWLGKARAGSTLSRISQSFAVSSEFVRRYGALSNAQFVDRAFVNVFGRAPDAGGRSYWIGKLDKGTSRGQVMANFSTSGEYVRKQATTCEVVVAYAGLLRRIPTAAELADASALVTEGGFVALAAQIAASPAWAARFPAPGAPTKVTATGGNALAKVRWTAPAAVGTGITGYVVRPYLGSTALADRTAGATATSLTVTGLTNGSTYTFAVFAVTASVMGPSGTSAPTLVKPEVVWSTVGGNPQHTNVQPLGTVPAAPTEKWERDFGEASPIQVVVGAGRIFALLPGSSPTSSSGARVYALDPSDGHVLWGPSSISGTYLGADLGYEEGRLFLENDDGLIRALDAATGSLLWSRALGNFVWDQEGVTVYDGTIFGFSGQLHAIDATNGAVKWKVGLGNGSGTPGADASGVYVSQVCNEHFRYTLTGTKVWATTPSCSGGGAGVASLHDGKMWGDGDWTGTPIILQQSNGALVDSYASTSPPALLGNRAYYNDGGTLTAVTYASGLTAWSQAGDGSLVHSPVINAGRAFIASSDGMVFSYDVATGTERWSRAAIDDLATPVSAFDVDMGQPVLGDGLLLVSVGGSLLAYG